MRAGLVSGVSAPTGQVVPAGAGWKIPALPDLETFTYRVIEEDMNIRQKKNIRSRLLAIYQKNGKVIERDLFRLSALTGINYSMIAEIHKSIRYQSRENQKRVDRKISGQKQ